MSSRGTGTKMANTNGKLSQEQRDHLINHHLGHALVGDKLHLTYLLECGNPEKDKACPLPANVSVIVCKRPPCP
jgi:hypothetical protein